MAENIELLVAYCSKKFETNVFPHFQHCQPVIIKFNEEPVDNQDAWDKFKNHVASGKFTHVMIDRCVRGHMGTNQYETLQRKVLNAGAKFILQPANGKASKEKLSPEERKMALATEIRKFLERFDF